MEKVPAYLAWYLLKIRRHSGEMDYFIGRFEDADLKTVASESQMNRELKHHGLISLPDETMEKVFYPDGTALIRPVPSGEQREKAGAFRVKFSPAFATMPRGHYLPWEYIANFFGRTFWIVATALIGIIVGLLIRT